MAYKELIKNFSKIRNYLREFFVYGYNSRGNVGRKSERSYDDEKRRIQSWLGDYVEENHGLDGKTTALSIDVRNVGFNPLYRAWKSASFTDKDITLHFIVMDILSIRNEDLKVGDCDKGYTLQEIISKIEDYLSTFSKPLEFDESTIRKKLSEYERHGLIEISKIGNKSVYSLSDSFSVFKEGVGRNEVRPQGKAFPFQIMSMLDFASEILPVGIIGSTLLDKIGGHESTFSFKHHYITQSMDSEIMATLFQAMSERRWVQVSTYNERKNKLSLSKGGRVQLIPLKIISSCQSGRQYLVAHVLKRKKFKSFRLDNILDVKILDVCHDFKTVKNRFNQVEKHLWGASFGNFPQLESVEFKVKFREDDEYIFQRLVRENRCGTVERLSPTEARFYAEVWDVHEMLPWIRTFIMRITELHISDKNLEDHFWSDVREMRNLYEL